MSAETGDRGFTNIKQQNIVFRILTFLAKQEAVGTSVALDSVSQSAEDDKLVAEDEDDPQEEETFVKRKFILKLSDASFAWKEGSQNVLHNLNLTIPNGALTIIIGFWKIQTILLIPHCLVRFIWEW